ncbi:hypothetical protein LCGC14_1734480 [marine sediment metagenome]|uniref:Calcineurin-like phosphoesterase domain-containing protein n=1 Tax=marine sediment metagenome TaxID=412755 RepID=A0A0F9H8K5_9ZZZZ
MKVVCIADTHGMHRQVEIPDGDIFIHALDGHLTCRLMTKNLLLKSGL